MQNLFAEAFARIRRHASIRDPYDTTLSPELEAYAAAVIERARGDLGVRERPRRSNRGPRIDDMVRTGGGRVPSRAGVKGPHWCAYGLYTWHHETAESFGVATTCPKTGRASEIWIKGMADGLRCITRAEILAGEPLIPGLDALVMSRPSSPERGAKWARMIRSGDPKATMPGHTALVTGFKDGKIHTIDCNSNRRGSATGGAVVEQARPANLACVVGVVRIVAVAD